VHDVSPISPLAATDTPDTPDTPATSATVVEITPSALAVLVGLRDAEPDAERLGLRLEITSQPGEEFRYDLSFETVTKAAFADSVRTHVATTEDGDTLTMKVIVVAASIELLQGATLDYSEAAGLLIRNPNKPAAASVEGLVADDELSAAIRRELETEINPSLAAHGGFVTFVGHDTEGTAYLTMGGGCHGCSMSRQTMLDGVQVRLVETIEGVLRVRDLTDHSSGENPWG